jgi:hypothetical protein
MGHQMIGAVALNAVNNFLLKLWFENIEGYVRFKKLYLKSEDQALKIKLFQEKNQILREVNLAIEKLWYSTRVEEIRFK